MYIYVEKHKYVKMKVFIISNNSLQGIVAILQAIVFFFVEFCKKDKRKIFENVQNLLENKTRIDVVNMKGLWQVIVPVIHQQLRENCVMFILAYKATEERNQGGKQRSGGWRGPLQTENKFQQI